MTIDRPTAAQLPQLRQLWQEAFGDTDAFLDAFFAAAMHPDRCRCVTRDGAVVAALYWFDCLYEGRKLAYLYAVATAKAYRGKGLCHALMADTHALLEMQGYAGAILVPQSEPLRGFYETMGYACCVQLRRFDCEAVNEPCRVRCIDQQEYARLRRELLPQRAVVQEQETLDFLQTYAKFYAGPGFLLAAAVDGDTLQGIELLGDAAVAPAIVGAMGCARGTFRAPGEGMPFAMYLPLGDRELPPPAYFGLALD